VALVKMDDILKKADTYKYGVGSFSVASLEMIMGTIKAAEELNAPIILQIAEGRLKYSPLHLIGPVMVEAARKAKVPVAVHLDHGLTMETIKQALDLGFTSIMFDGSKLPVEKNIKKTIEVIQLAKQYGAVTEAELGLVGGSEDDSEDLEIMATSIEEAKQFYECTGVDALAVAIGNAHGIYKSTPQLQFNRLKEIDKIVKAPLVLHGGSGITVTDFRACIQYGIVKINVMTATLNKVVEGSRRLLEKNPKVDYFTYRQQTIQSAYESVTDHIKAFQSENQA
jgi:fructose-bisphosphate aldolase class II